MSGKNQHHLWKFMQLGFVDKAQRKEKVWIYQKNRQAFCTNPRNHGAMKYFYTTAENSLADDTITKFESEIAPTIGRLRSSILSEYDISIVPRIISHFEVRSNFLRQHSCTIIEGVVQSIIDSIKNPADLSRFLHRQLTDHPEWINEKFEERQISLDEQKVIWDFLHVNLRDELRKTSTTGVNDFRLMFEQVKHGIRNAVTEAHNATVVKSGASPKERTKLYVNLRYKLQEFKSGMLLLPDTCVLHVTKSGLKPFISKDDVLDAIILPISGTIALVGSRDGLFSRSLEVTNAMLTSISFESFVATCEHSSFEKLKRKIGCNAKIVSDLEIKKIIREVLN